MASFDNLISAEPVPLEQPSEQQLDPAFVDRLKVAAATAIIRQKPTDMSGKAYAEQLARRLKERNESWRVRAKSLERELLQTRQEFLLLKTSIAVGHYGTDRKEAEIAIASKSTTTSSSLADAPFLTPPSSSEDSSHQDHDVALSKNTRFLFSLATLSSASTDSNPESCSKLHNQKTAEIITESIQLAVDFILGSLRSKPLSKNISLRMMQEAADSIVKTLEIGDAVSWGQDVIALASRLVDGILDDLLGNTHLSTTFSQRESCCIILRLARSPLLLPPITLSLLERMERTSASLRNIHIHGNGLDAQLLENSYFLFSTMEDILVSAKTASLSLSSTSSSTLSSSRANRVIGGGETILQGSHGISRRGSRHKRTHNNLADRSGCTTKSSSGQEFGEGVGKAGKPLSLDEGLRTNIQARLEDSLLHISSDFPLYAQYVWRLTGILELMNE